jgi:LPS export ABC transporter protein LptC
MWRFPIKILLILIIIFVAGGIVLILTSYRYWLKPESLVNSTIESNIDIGLKEIHHVALKKGKKLWDLTSESVQRINGQNNVTPLSLTFYPNAGDPIALKARHGIVNDNKDIHIVGDIVIKQALWQFVCDDLKYSYTRHEIIGNNNIAVTGRGLTITAKSMYYDLSSGQLTIKDSVSLTVTEPTALESGFLK